ncbi:MAG: peptidylprolyl isomerase [Candidatus Zambryskibacteria bacterium RIFCSPHIGHO2_12_FULL_44_12b]|uniref:Peptidyl-prolyl cis-trans isomerase n=1 Tax=Candidatus Zambryskibacteria bacterium RIFCSPLOWO2_01_FULL_45_21 TaxID=1802761 RepID=A0A1G2U0M3_9BACT|nr:MAG: peptidylprolyl isomerase [Candidatus Zambryskibacteria bacterium RIFCSPHIGHO2_12_FULL_44_12b]OHB03081.1 MAG: peptidylprolyl isomerase [Candidatus Zambryskibacteria bacterium RIFCSPLOWO2_01_FULL_45_21]
MDKGNFQVTDIVVGQGAEAKNGDFITVNYIGMFENGQPFESSYDRGVPLQFVLGIGQVIPGWEIGLLGMKEGGKRRIVIPPELAYGQSGSGPIPPNTTIVFEVELVKVQSSAQ